MNRPPPSEPRLDILAYQMAEAMQVAGVGRGALYDAINAGELVARKRGSTTLILRADLEAWLNSLPRLAETAAKSAADAEAKAREATARLRSLEQQAEALLREIRHAIEGK